jgi:hypothetical protein
MSASLAVQRLLVAALAGIPGISGVFDGPPPDAASPYLVVGADVVSDWSTKTEAGHEHRITITAWDAGPGTAPAKALLGAVEAAVAGLAGSDGGHAIVSARLLRSLVVTDPEGWAQGIIEFRIRSLGI